MSLSRDSLTHVSVVGLGVGSNHVYVLTHVSMSFVGLGVGSNHVNVLTLNPCVYVCSRSGCRL